jgi:hypothetical protein
VVFAVFGSEALQAFETAVEGAFAEDA